MLLSVCVLPKRAKVNMNDITKRPKAEYLHTVAILLTPRG